VMQLTIKVKFDTKSDKSNYNPSNGFAVIFRLD